MKKEYHGFRVELVEIPTETIITSSIGQCAYTTNYTTGDVPYDWNDYCEEHINEILKPMYYNLHG